MVAVMLQVNGMIDEHEIVAVVGNVGVVIAEIVMVHTPPTEDVAVMIDEPPGINDATREHPTNDAMFVGHEASTKVNPSGLSVTSVTLGGIGATHVEVNIKTFVQAKRKH